MILPMAEGVFKQDVLDAIEGHILGQAQITVAASVPPNSGLALTSASFTDDGVIPLEFSCTDRGLSPALAWTGVPADAVSLVLIMSDPDAPFDHWFFLKNYIFIYIYI